MAKYSAQLVAKSSENKNVTTTLSNVNPETAPVKIKQFAQTLNALTTNTYNETNYIVTTNLDTETPPVDTRQTPTLSASGMPTLSQINNDQVPGSYPAITYDGDGVTYVYRKSGCTLVEFAMVSNTNFAMRKMNEFSGQTATGGVYVVGATGTDNYKPVEVEYTLE